MGRPEAQIQNPLRELYGRHGRRLPVLNTMAGERLPSPFRELLVHSRDMTPTLEHHHQARLQLRVLDRFCEREIFVRMVALETVEPPHSPVEFGAIKIYLTCFSPTVRQQILECRIPMGTILHNYRLTHSCNPAAFFQVHADDLITAALQLPAPRVLYGRFNTLYSHHQELMAEVVEILPPTHPE